jgi:hypothetical protein
MVSGLAARSLIHSKSSSNNMTALEFRCSPSFISLGNFPSFRSRSCCVMLRVVSSRACLLLTKRNAVTPIQEAALPHMG